jgi:hypothetical protein
MGGLLLCDSRARKGASGGLSRRPHALASTPESLTPGGWLSLMAVRHECTNAFFLRFSGA